MKSTLVSKENNEAKLTLEFTAEEFDEAVNKVYRANRNQFSINGFRKGKAPRSIIERHYGEGIFFEDELMVRFGSDRISSLFAQMGDIPIENKTVSKAISSAQKRVEGLNFDIRKALLDYDDVTIIPYLRSISNMTEDEVEEWERIVDVTQNWLRIDSIPNAVNFFNKHHLDYHNLIEKGLALEAPTDMYKTE